MGVGCDSSLPVSEGGLWGIGGGGCGGLEEVEVS